MSESAKSDLRKLFDAKKPGRVSQDPVKFLACLDAAPDEECLAELAKLGIRVDSVVGNKITGQATSSAVTQLRDHANVTEVEVSVALEPKARPPEASERQTDKGSG